VLVAGDCTLGEDMVDLGRVDVALAAEVSALAVG
jgi:hypothetical protein